MVQRSRAPGAATPTRRTNGKRRVPLSEPEIVAAALAIIADAGVDALTMRALSDRLSVALGATYKYVANKRQLVELVVAELFSRIEHTDVEGADWQARINSMFLKIYDTFLGYPGLALQVTVRPLPSTRPPEILDTLMHILRAAGFTETTVQELILGLMYYSTGGVLVAGAYDSEDQRASFATGLDFLLTGARDRLELEHDRPGKKSSRARRT